MHLWNDSALLWFLGGRHRTGVRLGTVNTRRILLPDCLVILYRCTALPVMTTPPPPGEPTAATAATSATWLATCAAHWNEPPAPGVRFATNQGLTLVHVSV